jgi:AraC-like DNA-binding protein
MEFNNELDFAPEAAELFINECYNQKIQSYIKWPLFQYIIDDEESLWQIGSKIEEKIVVTYPLKIGFFDYNKTAEIIHYGSYSNLDYCHELLELEIENKNYSIIGPFIHIYLNKPENFDSPENRTLVIFPIQEKENSEIIIDNLYNYILTIASFLYLFFSLFLFLYKKGKRLNNRILAVFLLLNALILINWLIYNFRYYLIQPFPHIFEVFSSFVFLIPPFLFLYVQSQINPDFKLKRIHLLHLLPFLIDILFLTINFHILNPDLKRQLFLSHSIFTDSEQYIRSFSSEIQNFFYIIAALIIIRRYRRRIKQYFSNVESINLSWLNIVLFGYLTIQLIGMIKHNIHFFTGIYVEILGIMLILSLLVFAMIIIFKGLQHPLIFLEMPLNNEKTKYEKSKLADEYKEQYLKKLMEFMELEKPHLDPLINLKKIADGIKIPTHYLSQILNECLKQNFFDFINSYRIDECKKMLKDTSHHHKTVLEILYESGFNSKSVFNTYFLKQTGLTPTQYRKLHDN